MYSVTICNVIKSFFIQLTEQKFKLETELDNLLKDADCLKVELQACNEKNNELSTIITTKEEIILDNDKKMAEL